MNRKISLLQQWLKANNKNIQNEIAHCNDENKFRGIKNGLDIMVSVLTGVNITEGSNFYAIENLVGRENPTIDFIRKATYEELYHELTKLSDERGIKNNLSMLNYNKIIDLYEEKKAKGEVTMNGYEEPAIEKNSTESIERTANVKQVNNPSNVNQNTIKNDNFNGYNGYQSMNEYSGNGDYRANVNNSNNYSSGYSNNVNYTNQYQEGFSNTRDMVEMCGNSLDCTIHGVRVVIIPNENGDYTLKNHESYSQSMEIKFNGGTDSQLVNKKILSREEFNNFVSKYQREIFNQDYSYENVHLKENVESIDNEQEL